MKIFAIRGKNLASLEEEFIIDFTAEPLVSAGIFAITGSTGSGKSTLLDALCLALFDETPRTNRASENVQISDVKGKSIHQKDSRNILRRGAGDGYAEVDFLSLGGEKFRSRWGVRRSRDKIDGTLQQTEIKLTNLTTQSEVPGKKSELLCKIVELIGLTFDQFTRAVLLAQGDFATFLKATQKEKAELLEKLTGTDIYSHISMAIFDKSKKADQELNLVKERMKDIYLLTNEEKEQLHAERANIVQKIKILKEKSIKWNAKIKWINDERILNIGCQQGEKLWSIARKGIEEAKPRFDYLLRIDQVQEIRDDYHALKNSQKQIDENRKNLAKEEKQRNENSLLLSELINRNAECDKENTKFRELFAQIEPRIKQARELDVQLAETKKSVTEIKIEIEGVNKTKKENEKSIEKRENELRSSGERLLHLEKWFEEKSDYKEILSRIDLITNLLDDIGSATSQKEANVKTLQISENQLKEKIKLLTELQNKSTALNQMLPSEVVILRAKLVEGTPCPVCGNTHHPKSQEKRDSLAEDKLEKSKEEVNNKIAILTKEIENQQNEHIRLHSKIESYSQQSIEATEKLKKHLQLLPQWEAEFEQGKLQERLQHFANTWKSNEQQQSKLKAHILQNEATLKIEKVHLEDIINSIATKELKYNNRREELSELQKRRNELLEGRDADEVEKSWLERSKYLADMLLKLSEEKNKIIASNEKKEGVIAQLSKEIERLSESCSQLMYRINKWFTVHQNEFTKEELPDLLSKETDWISNERLKLEKLKQDETSAVATLKERRQNLEKHYLSENRPSEEESEEQLSLILKETEDEIDQKTARQTEIDIGFNTDQMNQKRFKQFEDEHNKKVELAENWKKLNIVFGSADGAKFKVLAQGYTLDALLSYSNQHLKELSKRYEIQRIPDTLALQVIDLDMLGEIRTVHSLSGGESFLISLALALGLSSLSSNRMKIESLFIDEGFGSLDIDTLRVAMDTLESLQTQGRKICVISHVAEMTERIGTQIHVEKMANGKSRVLLLG